MNHYSDSGRKIVYLRPQTRGPSWLSVLNISHRNQGQQSQFYYIIYPYFIIILNYFIFYVFPLLHT